MTIKREYYEMMYYAIENGWDDNRKAAMMYVMSVQNLAGKLDFETMPRRVIEEIADQAEEVYDIACRKHALEQAMAEQEEEASSFDTKRVLSGAAMVGLMALRVFMGHRR